MNSFTFPVPTDHAPGGWHSAYMEVYEKLFSPIKNAPVQVLEIGTDGGGGLLAYQEYFKKARVYGMDINPPPSTIQDQVRIRHFQRDAYTMQSFQIIKDELEVLGVIIDDGPHTLGSQEFFVQNYPTLLSRDGVAIVEDIQEYGHAQHLAKLVPEGFFSSIIDLRHVNGRYDDLLLVIWRK